MKRGGPLPRRTPLRAKTPLKTSKPLRRRRYVVPGQRTNAEFRKVRGWVSDRAGGMCEARVDSVCTGRGGHAHHVLMRSQGGTDDMGNLIWVCPSCHDHIHDNPAWAYAAGLLRKRGAA